MKKWNTVITKLQFAMATHSVKTQSAYLRHVKHFAIWVEVPPCELTQDDFDEYFLYIADEGYSESLQRQCRYALNYLDLHILKGHRDIIIKDKDYETDTLTLESRPD